jgi:hypothetical protein
VADDGTEWMSDDGGRLFNATAFKKTTTQSAEKKTVES